jgi:hypothetical protein
MEKSINLLVNGRSDGIVAMSDIEAADASGEINQDIAVNVLDECAVSFCDVNRRSVRETARDGLFAAAV